VILNNNKYLDETTGAHFDFDVICRKIEILIKQRKLSEIAPINKNVVLSPTELNLKKEKT
jgi:hypothetical protein